ncbi:MAG TPA: CPBP family intramembrane glutamic endopeptidase [Methanocella sp.]|nr:CPBP family intramembrane glutamic endopeptidase [Methanocella sp.]
MSKITGGARKPKKGTAMKGTSTGELKFTPELVIVLLIAGLYTVFLIETRLDNSLISLILSAFLVIVFLVFAYTVRAGTHKRKREFSALIYVFLGLSTFSLAWECLTSLSIIDATRIGPVIWPGTVGTVNAIVSLVIIGAIVYLDKIPPEEMFLTLGDTKVVMLGVITFALSILLATGAAYLIFGGAAMGPDRLLQLTISVIVFGILSGVVEEFWFRGLMMSRIMNIIGESQGNIIQAVVFGAFEAMIFYTITGEITLLPAIFIIGAMTGYYWGRATLKSGSLLSSALIHAGFYMLITLPILVSLMS